MSKNFPPFVEALPEWHPIKTYFKENAVLLKLLHEIAEVNIDDNFQLFFNLFNQIATVDVRYTRKENQLFPYLEKHGWLGPSQGMWSFHDANRDIIRTIRKKIEARDLLAVKELTPMLIGELERMMLVEEMRLLPHALDLLNENDWVEMSKGEEEIGWAFNLKLGAHSPSVPQLKNDVGHKSSPHALGQLRAIDLEEGFLNEEQINLMLKFLPIDLTYVDEFDRVIFYNRGEERVFPRSAAVIGREVRFCHPPKSVGTVLQILEEFKKGTKDEAEFWIDYREKKIHIRYFAIRDKEKNYKGVIEVSQDITKIMGLTGEQRLLSWN